MIWQVTLFRLSSYLHKILVDNNGQIGELDLEAEKELDVERGPRPQF